MPTRATTRMGLENTMRSERSQTQKATRYVIPSVRTAQNRQVYRDRMSMRGRPGLGRWWGEGVERDC